MKMNGMQDVGWVGWGGRGMNCVDVAIPEE
jgi:hypothetical protein